MKSEVFNADRQRNTEVNNLLQRIRYEMGKLHSEAKYVFLPTIILNDGRSIYQKDVVNLSRLNELKDMGAVKVEKRSIEEMNETLEETKSKGLIVEGVLVEPIEPKFSRLCSKFEKLVAVTSPEDNRQRFFHKLQAGTEWKNFIIQFVNKEQIYIQINRFKENANYIETGFVDKRFIKPQPNEGWTFLWVLAKYNGELTIKDPDAKDTYKKQKGLVSEALKSYFSMESDPFYPYQETKSYKTRFTLLPPPEESEGIKHQIPYQKEVEQESVDEKIRQFIEEQAPQVYDEKEW